MVKEKSPQTKSAAEAFYKGAFGFKPSEKIERLEKFVALQYLKFKQTAEEIAEDLGMPVEEVWKIIETYKTANQ